MARIYAGIMGPLAFATALARGLINSAEVITTLAGACLALLVFAALGYIVGSIASRIVEESVSALIKIELAREQASEEAQPAGSTL